MSPLTSFPLFSHLPPELRRQIWHEYLHNYDTPTIYLYSKNFFLKCLDPEGEDERYAGISHTPLVQVSIPESVYVNTEAREFAMQWARARDISVRWRQETKGHVFARPFDPARDALYVSRDKWEEFCELTWESDGLEETAALLQHLAFPAFTAYYSFTEMGYLMSWFPSLRTLASVWGSLPDVKYSRTKKVPRRRQNQQQHPLGTDDDGTDTGVDPATGDMEERIAAEVQPRWELRDETAEVVSMCVRDPLDGSESWEDGELDMWMGELQEGLMTVELPDHVYDADDDKFLIELRAVKVERATG
ncbi:hypothetical protein QQS21_009363 [Conoideocrella luteorostrata]|uniref:2EXR domain-containing protein n=1 Tax=Conoideocrella luteorostrata TaxID=1105319 RepID=A0AAJ0CLH7_9HYPO|nr:hypothetical protein QQS21_009363 [Conoideocrella luteorostrata]